MIQIMNVIFIRAYTFKAALGNESSGKVKVAHYRNERTLPRKEITLRLLQGKSCARAQKWRQPRPATINVNSIWAMERVIWAAWCHMRVAASIAEAWFSIHVIKFSINLNFNALFSI